MDDALNIICWEKESYANRFIFNHGVELKLTAEQRILEDLRNEVFDYYHKRNGVLGLRITNRVLTIVYLSGK